MPEIDFLRTFIEGRPARHVRLAAARRLVPLPPAQMLALLVHLLGDPEPEVSASARDSLAGVPEQELLLALGSRDCPSAVLEHFSVPGGSSAVLEAIVLNPATPHSAVARIATHAPADTLLLILYNRVRLLEHPEIMQCVRCNPSLNSEVERTLREIEQ